MGLDPANDEYRKGFQREYCLFGSILFAISERHEIIFENYAGDLTNEEKKKIFEKVERSQVFSS